MDLEYRDVVEAVSEGIRASRDPGAPPGSICPIPPIDGQDEKGRMVRAIGVCWYDEMMQFVAVVTDPIDDSIYPITLETIYPVEPAVEQLPAPIESAGAPPARHLRRRDKGGQHDQCHLL